MKSFDIFGRDKCATRWHETVKRVAIERIVGDLFKTDGLEAEGVLHPT